MADSRVQQENISDVCATGTCAGRRSLSMASCPFWRVALPLKGLWAWAETLLLCTGGSAAVRINEQAAPIDLLTPQHQQLEDV